MHDSLGICDCEKVIEIENSRPQRRKHYRLQYPLQSCPSLTLRGQNHRIGEVSEEGARIVAGAIQPSVFADRPQVTIDFPSGAKVTTTASFLRLEDTLLVLKLHPPISLAIILAEQMWLVRRYPKDQAGSKSSR